MDSMSRRSFIIQSKEPEKVRSKFLGDNWFEVYTLFQKDSSSIDEKNFHLDILQDLCNESLNSNIILHLLTLLEQWYWMFQDIERLEQTVGSLINIFTSSTRLSSAISCKYLFTCTTLLACNLHIIEKNAQLQKLLSSFLKVLVDQTNLESGSLSQQANECLIQFEECSPKILKNYLIAAKINENNVFLNSLLIRNGVQLNPKSIKIVIDSLPSYTCNPYRLNLIFNYLFDSMKSKNQLTISPFIFKQFIKTFIYSSEIYNFHFALLLQRSFGLELFSTCEEFNLLSRLALLSTHPSLNISTRLLILDFVKSLIPSLKAVNLFEAKTFELSPFDGPDTQEKKLLILSETEIKDDNLILNLKTMETTSLNFANQRATNSLYRLFYGFLKNRPSLQENIEMLIISMIFASPKQYMYNSLVLLKSTKCLASKVCKTFIKKLVTISKIIEEAKEDDLEHFIFAIEWFLKQSEKLIIEEELAQLLEFCFKSTQINPKLVKKLLDCCAVVIRTQQVTENIKSILNSILNYFIASKKDVTISSWSQIYSIAINTLPNNESLQKVFCEDVNLNQGTPLLVYNCNKCPLIIERINSKLEPFPIDSEFFILLQLKISLDSLNKQEFKKIFAIELRFSSIIQNIDEVINIPFLDCNQFKLINLNFKPIKLKPFEMKISTRFTDKNGITYFFNLVEKQKFDFESFLNQITFSQSQFDLLWNQSFDDKENFESVFCLEKYSQVDEIFKENQFLKQFVCCTNCQKLMIGLSPNKLLLMKLIEMNNVVILKIKTNESKVVKYIYYLFKKV